MGYRTTYPGGPDEPWDDTVCFNCGCDLPDEDPGDDYWWEGYCSEPCRRGEPVSPDEDQLKSLDAYDHLTYTTGYSDEWNEDVGEDSDRGDWMVCFDFRVWKHPSRGVLVAYHVVVNSDSGGFIDTVERGVVEADKAPFTLPDYWTSIGMDDGTPWTEQECKHADDCQERWEADLREAIEQAKEGE
jgi:hypothetical protein